MTVQTELSHLLHGLDISKEISRCFQAPLQSQCMTAGTGPCCPIWASPQLHSPLLLYPSLAGKKAQPTRDWSQIVCSQEFSRPQRFLPGDSHCSSLTFYSLVGRLLLAGAPGFYWLT